ncbi:hypothetical protein KUV26_07750 [Leisingera daeponensis]|uniref:HNH endonuclease n=1 Tax=Leisingera daeponensis TaxID=405746 RepID=A0ABS7NDQ2_9RHOB|nr:MULTISPECIES: hypothetical protein [Leisingera]MBY6139330.1 hypothetical protein [Leisingera daeponensis]
MIKVPRDPTLPDLPVYTRQNSKALDGTKITKYDQEKEKAIAFFTDPANYENDEKKTKKSFKFVVYKNDGLVALLEKTFGKKCAYCESNFAAVTPSDIEHFRPKSAIKIDAGELKPGYFWLAGDWTNLLISCPDCNRSRTHEVPGQSAGVVLGKATQFPLADEATRVRAPADSLAAEEAVRLLIDPCVEDPEDHLEFDLDGNVRARIRNGVPSDKGAVSIDVYALRRKALVEARKAALLDLEFSIEELTDLVIQNNRMHEDGVAPDMIERNKTQIARCMKRLAGLFDDNAEYLAAKHDWLRARNEAGAFALLGDFGIDPMDLIAA